MLIKSFDKSLLGANMYFMWSKDSYIIVDPCCEPDLVREFTEANNLDYKALKAIFVTHGHFDHISTVDSWKSEFPSVPVYIDDEDLIIGEKFDKIFEVIFDFIEALSSGFLIIPA